MISALSFTKAYSSKAACSNVFFEAPRGKVTVLLGPNGAGKSTLLKALAGFHYGSGGKILVQDSGLSYFDAAEFPEKVKAISGFVSDVPSLLEDWTVQEFLRNAADLRLPKKAGEKRSGRALVLDEAAKRAAALCKLQEAAGQKISSLSHGYKQRLNLAAALVADPQIIILDEPSAGLDPEQIKEMRSLVQKLKKDRAVIFSTHIIQEAQILADEIYIMKNGRVAARGSVQELLKKSGSGSLEDAYLFFAEGSSKPLEEEGLPEDSLKKEAVRPEAKEKFLEANIFSGLGRLVKSELFSCGINPVNWILGIFFGLFSALSYFYGTAFFGGGGNSSLAPFFLAMPYVLTVLIPSFCANARSPGFDQSLPFGELKKSAARILAVLIVFCLCLLPTLLVPLCVSFFGSVELGVLFTGYGGLFFYAAAAISFCVFLSKLFYGRASYFAAALLSLAALNSAPVILTRVPLPEFLSNFIRYASFPWRFDSASKGVLDTRDFCFFVIAAAAFLLLSVFAAEKKKGKKYFCKKNALKSWTVIFIFVFLLLDANRIFVRFDLTAEKNYTPSLRTKRLLDGAEEKVRFSFYRSSELLKLYPQIRDVGDFLRSLCDSCGNALYVEMDADKPAAQKILNELSVQPFQLQKQKDNSLEYINAYSAIVIDYMDKSLLIPAAFSTFSLEYDINVRLDFLLNQKSRRAYVLCGNGMSLEKDYKAALDWLNLEGFETIPLKASALKDAFLDKSLPLIVFGTKEIDIGGTEEIQRFLEGGGAVLAMASPYKVDVDGGWTLSKNKGDSLLPLFERFGISFLDSLAADLSCVRANFYSAEEGQRQNQSVNYPLWIDLLPQDGAPYGAATFWASPLSLDKDKALSALETSRASWRFLPDKKNPSLLFDTNPFSVPKTAIADPLIQKEKSVLAAKSLAANLFVISGDLFANDLILSLSGGESGDFRNLNYLTSSLLDLTGEKEMADLKQKGASDHSLWKLSSGEEWKRAKNLSLFLNFVLAPIVALAFMFLFFWRRKHGKKIL